MGFLPFSAFSYTGKIPESNLRLSLGSFVIADFGL